MHEPTAERGRCQPGVSNVREIVVYELLSLDGVAEGPDEFITDWDDAMDANLAAVIATQDASPHRHAQQPSPARRSGLGELNIPTLVLGAPGDPCHPFTLAQTLSTWIPKARFVEVPRKTWIRANTPTLSPASYRPS